MILVRKRNGTLYFLTGDEDDAMERLRGSYPGRALALLKKGDGLAIIRVGEPRVEDEAGGGDRLAIVNLVLPPAPVVFSVRG